MYIYVIKYNKIYYCHINIIILIFLMHITTHNYYLFYYLICYYAKTKSKFIIFLKKIFKIIFNYIRKLCFQIINK